MITTKFKLILSLPNELSDTLDVYSSQTEAEQAKEAHEKAHPDHVGRLKIRPYEMPDFTSAREEVDTF